MTLKEAQQIARHNGMSIQKTSAGDYRINFIYGKEIWACYEESVEDALDTARTMRNKYPRR